MKNLVAILFFSLLTLAGQAQKTGSGFAGSSEKQMVKFYPNPAVNFINFEFKSSIEKGANFQVFSFLGRRIVNTAVSGSRLVVNTSDYLRGVYIFQLLDERGRILETSKFQVTK